MSDILWAIVSSFFICLLNSKTKKENKFYRKKEIQNIVKKYKISAEIIGSLFLIVLCVLILLALYQSGQVSCGCYILKFFIHFIIDGLYVYPCIHSLQNK